MSDSFVPIGIAGLLMCGSGLGWSIYDRLTSGAFWGWGITAFTVACMIASAWVATCYRVVKIDRKARTVRVVYRGGYGFKNNHSLWKQRKHESSLDEYIRVATTRHMERRSEGKGEIAVYSLMLESESGERLTVYRHTVESYALKETKRLADFLGLPYRQVY